MIEETKQTITYAEPYSVTLTRGAKGDYRWDLKVRDSDPDRLLTELTDLDKKLRIRFGEAQEKVVNEA